MYSGIERCERCSEGEVRRRKFGRMGLGAEKLERMMERRVGRLGMMGCRVGKLERTIRGVDGREVLSSGETVPTPTPTLVLGLETDEILEQTHALNELSVLLIGEVWKQVPKPAVLGLVKAEIPKQEYELNDS